MATTRAIRKDEVDLWAQRMGQYIEDNSVANPATSPDWCFCIGLYTTSQLQNNATIVCDGETLKVSEVAKLLNSQYHIIICPVKTALPEYVLNWQFGSSFDTSAIYDTSFRAHVATFVKKEKFYYTELGESGSSSICRAILGAGDGGNTPVYSGVGFSGIRNYFGVFYSSGYGGIMYPYGLSFSTNIPGQTSGTNNLYYYDRYRYTALTQSYKVAGSRSAYPTGQTHTNYIGAGSITSNLIDEMAQSNISDAQVVPLYAQIKTKVPVSSRWSITIQNPFKGCKQLVINL